MKEKREIDVHVGTQIKKAREAAGYTQDKFAEIIQMGTKNVSSVERGLTGVSVSTIRKICQALSISSDMLIMDETYDLDAKKLDLLVERLKRLSPHQLELALDINNKLFEIFTLQSSIKNSSA